MIAAGIAATVAAAPDDRDVMAGAAARRGVGR